MAIACIGVVVERMIMFAKGARESRAFARKVAPNVANWEIEEVAAATGNYKNSPLAKLFGFVIDRYLRSVEQPKGGLTPVEMARHECERRQEQAGSELRRGMSVLASVGSVAPFVGLLGTVLGIITSFQSIGAEGSGGINTVMTGIAEALAETALGLLVAIPAVLLFNYLSVRVAGIELALSRSAGELLDEMEYRDGCKPEAAIAQKAA
jgi:biopolymer transport protein ExbB